MSRTFRPSPIALASIALALAACRKPDERPREILPAPIASFAIDTAERGELAEGTKEAFGLRLPRSLAVKATFPDAIHAAGPGTLEAMANYVRERVDTMRIETGPVKTVFDKAKLKRDPTRLVRVEVAMVARGRIEMVVRDQTPKPATGEGLSEAAQWQRTGRTADGKVLPEANQ